MATNSTQMAFGRNFALQRELDSKKTLIRRNFKFTRRKQEAFEEECVSSLYKLLLYSKERQDADVTESADTAHAPTARDGAKSAPPHKRPYSVFEIAQNPHLAEEAAKRPATAMSHCKTAKAYVQSYSFAKDGMNIGRTRRETYLRSRTHKQKQQDAAVILEREKTKDQYKFEDEDEVDVKSPAAILKSIPDADSPPTDKNATTSLVTPPASRTGASTPVVRITPLPTVINLNESNFDEVDSKITPRIVNEKHHGNLNQNEAAKVSLLHKRSTSPTKMFHAATQGDVNGRSSVLSVRIAEGPGQDASPRMPSRPGTSFDVVEEELIPLTEDDKNHLNALTGHQSNGHQTRATPRSKSSLSYSEAVGTNNLVKATEKTQSFLKDYSKKSKIFGYVVKTRTSSCAPRERQRSYRSPCITYQELVAIKAGIRQHEARTKTLLQGSAKLSTYVDKLANASRMRAHRESLLAAHKKLSH